MNSESKHLDEPENEYAFGLGVRGRQAQLATKSGVPRLSGDGVEAWVPLIHFPWSGSEHAIASDISITAASAYSGYQDPAFEASLSSNEREECRTASHWLRISTRTHSDPSARVLVNAFLVALWIVAPTRTQAILRFEESSSGVRHVSRLLDRFQWVEGHVIEELATTHIDEVSRLLVPIREALRRRKRLADSLMFTFRGCVTSQWRPAFICYAAAFESLLAHREESTRVEDLATLYNALVATQGHDVTRTADEFHKLYSIRNAIVHGRLASQDTEEALDRFAAFGECLRQLWQVILRSVHVQECLELDDRHRATLLRRGTFS